MWSFFSNSLLWSHNDLDSRYQGTSSTSITYGYLIATIMLLSANYLFKIMGI